MPYTDPEKQRAYQREWAARRRAEWLAGKSCAWCGSTDDLEVDHVDPQEKVSHRIWNWAQDRREEELAKCQVLCGKCHAAKTRDDRPEVPHGTHTRYVHYRCRCRLCKDAHAAMNRKYRGDYS